MKIPEKERGAKQRPIYWDKNLQIIFGITLMAIIGVTSITPAFPKIAQELKIPPNEVGLLISVFTGPMIVLTLIFGMLGDRLERKKIIVPSLFIYGIAGGGCSLARDFNILLILRFFQGVGGSALFPLALSTICDIYSGKERTAALGYNSSINHLGHTIFPAIGGALAMFGWNYPFMLATLAIPIGLLVLFSMKSPKQKIKQGFRGYLITAFSSMKNIQVVGLFIASAFLFIITYGAYLTYLPFLLANSFGASPFVIGLIILIMYFTSAITSSQLGKLAKIIPEKSLIKIALLLYLPALVFIPSAPDIWVMILPVAILGIVWGISIPTIYAILGELAPEECRAAFISVDEMFVRVGQTLGPILMVLAFSAWGISGVFYAAAIFSIVMLALVVIMVR